MTINDPCAVRYGVDKDDRICCVNDGWTNFARAHGAPELSPEYIIGKPIWNFLQGDEIIDTTRGVFEKVRATGAAFIIPFRCDMGEKSQPMVMLLMPGDNGSIEISTRSVPAHLAGDVCEPVPLTQRIGDMLKVCAWCCRIELLSKIWVEPEFAIGDLSLLSARCLPPVSHGICPECFDEVRSKAFV